MKKNYNAPKMEQMTINPSTIICISAKRRNLFTSNKEETDDNSKSIWDKDSEE